jgi:hypothetical protein
MEPDEMKRIIFQACPEIKKMSELLAKQDYVYQTFEFSQRNQGFWFTPGYGYEICVYLKDRVKDYSNFKNSETEKWMIENEFLIDDNGWVEYTKYYRLYYTHDTIDTKDTGRFSVNHTIFIIDRTNKELKKRCIKKGVRFSDY